MELIGKILILIVFFNGISFIVHTCSKNRYAIEFNFKEKKIKVYPARQDKQHQTTKR